MTTKIEWVRSSNGEKGETWNPLAGCSRKSDGCRNCYAEKMTKRLEAMGVEKYQGLLNDHGRFNGNVKLDRDALMIPLKRKKPTTYFVNSMSDWCHENVSDDWRDQMLAIAALTPQHTYQYLTKRADRMQEYLSDPEMPINVIRWIIELQTPATRFQNQAGVKDWWPLKNVWFGVSVEDQFAANERIPLLLDTPAAVRFLSVEPLLGPVALRYIPTMRWRGAERINALTGNLSDMFGEYVGRSARKLDWIIVGGESGSNARLFYIDWIRPLIRQCKAANVPVFVKQLGGNIYCGNDNGFEGEHDQAWPVGTVVEHTHEGAHVRLKDKKGGDMSEWPLDLRIREMPQRFAS